MYLKHFGLRALPFSLTPDTEFFFKSPCHVEALNVLLVALRSGEGFIKVTGEVGLGKTLLCRRLLNTLQDEQQFRTAYIPNPHLSPGSMRLALSRELEIPLPRTPKTQDELLAWLNDALMEFAQAGKQVVLCLDESQEIPFPTLEAVRLLTNLETEKRKLLQVVLFGQPELERKLNEQRLRQLRQRITFSYTLAPMNRDMVAAYVVHRMRVAGYRGPAPFTAGALTTLSKASCGTPRLINILCHKGLMAAYGLGAQHVDKRAMQHAVHDTDGARRRGGIAGLVAAGFRRVAGGRL